MSVMFCDVLLCFAKLEDVFAAMRETLRGAQECAHALEVKDEDTEDRGPRMSDNLIACSPVHALGFGVYAKWLLANVSLWHNASEDRVWCLVSDIVTGNVDPLQASWCKVQVASCKLQVVSGKW